jgi:hypothetical protein
MFREGDYEFRTVASSTAIPAAAAVSEMLYWLVR